MTSPQPPAPDASDRAPDGRHHRAADLFCPHCGAKVLPAAPPPTPPAGVQAAPAPPPPLFMPESVVYGPPALPDDGLEAPTPPPKQQYPPKSTVYGIPAIRQDAPPPPMHEPMPAVYGGPGIAPRPASVLARLIVLLGAAGLVAAAVWYLFFR
ncbi:MAG: hypothetical protein KIS92_21155 [Planctomycetota bacterium]|nr:hypothetical protein [Planctomycetota bacterium]